MLAREPAPLACPGDVIVARGSGVTAPGDLRRMVRRHHFGVHYVDGDHLFPLNRPENAAASVLDLIGPAAGRADDNLPTGDDAMAR